MNTQPAGSVAAIANLLDAASWARLPGEVRERFSRGFEPDATTCYRGRVTHTRLSRLGWLLAQLTRLIGAPLPLHEQPGLATVIVTDHPGTSGQVWTRLYHKPNGVPQVIQSVKRLSGPTGLEELLGYGFSIALELSVENGALVFTGRDYFWQLAGVRFRLPACLTPGILAVKNRQQSSREFCFELTLVHPWFGKLIEQQVCFDDDVTSVAQAPGARRDFWPERATTLELSPL